jgi:hypothetical protein
MRAKGILLIVTMLAAACGPAVAQDWLPLGKGQSAVVFLLGGDAINGEIQVREKARPVVAWSTLVGQNAARRFTVKPGSYLVQLDPTAATATIEARPGTIAVVSLSGIARDGGSFTVAHQDQVLPEDVEGSQLGTFVIEHHVSEQALRAVSLEHLGTNLVFVVRPEF